jgi:NADPH:quinone reductase-like Zn-dependent oxidoreductase
MKAITYGPSKTLRLAEIDKPAPAEDEVLLRVRAAAVNPVDYHFLGIAPLVRNVMYKMLKARVYRPGVDVAGAVEAVGSSVDGLSVGDEVFGSSGGGAYAEYACVPAAKLVRKPANVSFEEAAAANIAGLTALQGLRDAAGVTAGQKVIVNGASGGVGTFAVQIAKWLGAEVTAVSSARNLDLVKNIGADYVIDYARQDFIKGDIRYDVIFDLVGDKKLRAFSSVLPPTGGKWIGAGGVGADASMIVLIARIFTAPVMSIFSKHTFKPFIAKSNKADLELLAELLSAGEIRSVIDRTFHLHQVPEAVEYVKSKHARGKVAITI